MWNFCYCDSVVSQGLVMISCRLSSVSGVCKSLHVVERSFISLFIYICTGIEHILCIFVLFAFQEHFMSAFLFYGLQQAAILLLPILIAPECCSWTGIGRWERKARRITLNQNVTNLTQSNMLEERSISLILHILAYWDVVSNEYHLAALVSKFNI